MDKASIKSKFQVETKGIEIMRVVAKARGNVKAEVKRNGKGEMTLGLCAAEGIEKGRTRAEANMRGARYRPCIQKNMLTVTMNILMLLQATDQHLL